MPQSAFSFSAVSLCREQLKELAELDKESREYSAQLSSALAKAEELRKGNSAVLRSIADDRLQLS